MAVREEKRTNNRTMIPNLKTMQLQVIRVQVKTELFFFFFFWLNYIIQGHLFTSPCIRIASIVLCVVLQNMPTHVSEVGQSGPVFYSCSVFVPFWSSLLLVVSVKEWGGKFALALNLSNSLNDNNNKNNNPTICSTRFRIFVK